MNVEMNSSRTAVVDRGYQWRKITKDTPRGTKLQLIRKDVGVAQYGTLSAGNSWYTHWAPLPTFDRELKLFARVIVTGVGVLISTPKELVHILPYFAEDGLEYQVEHVHMTDEDFDALNEFDW